MVKRLSVSLVAAGLLSLGLGVTSFAQEQGEPPVGIGVAQEGPPARTAHVNLGGLHIGPGNIVRRIAGVSVLRRDIGPWRRNKVSLC